VFSRFSTYNRNTRHTKLKQMAKPKLALIPAAQGSDLYSVLPSSGVGDFDFSRSGTATRINSQGLIEEVGDGVSRLNYPMIDGKVVGCPHHILEPARTNLVTYSEEFSNAAWSKSNSSITSNSVISPDGTLNASTLTDNTVNGIHRLRDSISLSASTDYSLSVFAKKGTLSNIQLALINTGNSSTSSRVFDLENGALGESLTSGGTLSNSKITDYGNGWFKCEITSQLNSTPNTYQITLATKSSGNATNSFQVTYDGDGSGNVYLYGAQLEEGSHPTSYIPTNGESGLVTRSAETANGSGDAATFNDSEGVLMVEISSFEEIPTTSEHIVLRNSASTNFSDSILIQHRNDGNLRIYADGFATGNIQFIVTDINWLENNKIAIQYDSISSNYKLFLNGIAKARYSNATNQSVVGLNDISFYWGSVNNPFYGNTKQLQYFETALTDSELEQITSWTSFTDMAQGQQYSIK